MDPTYQHAHEILPGLWLGDYKASQDETFLRAHHIDVVFNCTKDLPFTQWIEHKYRVPVDDNLEEEEIRNLELWAGEITFKLIRHYTAGHRILVHCFAGRQRSAASVAFFLIAFKRMRTEEVIPFIKSKREVAFYPRPNFIKSIAGFDRRFQQEILPSLTGLRIS
jgi:dual specificity phosphatase 12